jgi:tetratricopeptide (TPR) repeat protein
MEPRLDFRFSIPKPPDGPVIELSAAEAERFLLQRLAESQADPTPALWQLAQFYKINKQHEKALEYLRRLLRRLPDPESKAECVFTMGQAMEQVGDYVAAVRYYKEAFALEPAKTFTWYFINNNLGYSLNMLGRFAEGEDYCRKAIEVDPSRPNGHKNLGMALAGQERYREAAQCFVTATQVNAADPRAFHLLEDLLKQHPELQYEFQDAADLCRKAVEVAAEKAARSKPVVQRGWRRQLALLSLKLRPVLQRLRGRFGHR